MLGPGKIDVLALHSLSYAPQSEGLLRKEKFGRQEFSFF
jgi:hypothetical protein